MAKQSQYLLANYDGGVASHPQPEARGFLALNGERWELHFKGSKQLVHGGLRRYRFEVTAPDPKNCHVIIIDNESSAVQTTFDLPGTSADRFTSDVQARLRAIEATAQRSAAVNAGQWWLNADVFKGFGLARTLSISETDYLGGWSGHPKGHKRDILQFSQSGINYKAFRTLFSIPWAEVVDIAVEGPDQAASRLTATRMVTMGVFALAAKKKSKSAVVIVQLKSGEEACFHTEKFVAPQLRAKLSPVISQLHRVAAAAQRPAPAPQAPPQIQPPAPAEPARQPSNGLFVADELRKLAELRDRGVITEEQFTAQRDKLMS